MESVSVEESGHGPCLGIRRRSMVDHRTHSTATKQIPLLLWRGKSLLASKNARNNSNSWRLGTFVCALELARMELYCTPKVYIRRSTKSSATANEGRGEPASWSWCNPQSAICRRALWVEGTARIHCGIVVSSVFGAAVLTKKEIRRSRRVSGWIVDVRLFR